MILWIQMEIKTTADGSHTLFIPELNEHYHSTFGAVQESRHIFISQGLDNIDPEINPVNILEMGFGTGLNAFLTYLSVMKTQRKVNYTGVEKFPLSIEVTSQLNFPDFTGENSKKLFNTIHDTAWDQKVVLAENFSLLKIKNDIQSVELIPGSYDLVYFDAFGPEVQPELWSEVVFRKICPAMKPSAILVTYSAKGSVRRALKAAGFSVEKIPGPPGKREIVRAIKK